MPDTIRCQCGNELPYENEDRGGGVNCPACGQVVLVASPDEEATTAPAVSAGAVFDRSVEKLSERIVDHVTCRCTKEIPVRIADVGHHVSCPECGTHVQVGQTLGSARIANGTAADIDRSASTSRPQHKAKTNRRFKSSGRIAVFLLIIASIAVGTHFTWNYRHSAKSDWPEPKPLDPQSGTEAAEFQAEDVTPEKIEELPNRANPYHALMFAFGWERGLRANRIPEDDPRYAMLANVAEKVLNGKKSAMLESSRALLSFGDAAQALQKSQDWLRVLRAYEVPEDDERIVLLTQTAKDLIERADPITVEMIADLIHQEDDTDALVQAQLWQEELRHRKASESDLRFVKLAEVMKVLRQRLEATSGFSDEVVAQFRGLVNQLYAQLHDKKYEEARGTVEQIESLLAEHPEDLKYLTQRFLKYKATLQQAELLAKGTERIRALLNRAKQLLQGKRDEDVTDALIARANAKFLARITPMKRADAEQFAEIVKEFAKEFQFAQGRRAISEAQKCQQLNDIYSRNREVRRAYALLQGLLEDEIRSLLKQVRQWKGDADKSATAAGKPTSQFGKTIVRRSLFEDALEPFGNGDNIELAKVCTNYHRALTASERSGDPRYAQLLNMLFDVIESKISKLHTQQEKPSAADLRKQVVSLHRALDAAKLWRNQPRWKTLDGAIREHAVQLAKNAIQQARELAAADQLNDAVETIQVAIELGDAETSGQARILNADWASKVHLRADKEAERESLAKITRLMNDKKTFECWIALDRFVDLYPKSQHLQKVKEFQQKMEEVVRRRFEPAVHHASEQLDEGYLYVGFLRLRVLRGVAKSEMEKQTLAPVVAKADQIKRRVESQFTGLGFKSRMLSERDVLEVRRVSTLMVAIDPQHLEARRMLEEAKQQGGKWAERLLNQANNYKSVSPRLYNDRLTRAAQLDPEGPHGRKARQLLAELSR